jgi:hypothetical protein
LLTDGEKKKIAQSDVSEQAATKSKTEEAPVPPLSPVARKPQEEESPRLSSPPEVAKPIPPVPVEPAKEPPAKPAEKEKPEIAKEQPKEPPAPVENPTLPNSPPLSTTSENAKSAEHRAAQQEVDLFNGRDLEGWSVVYVSYSKSRKNTSWHADSARRVLASKGHDWNDLRTDRTFKNFTLTLEWRFTPGGFVSPNGSGVIVRSNGLGPKDNDPQGIEIDLRPNKNEQNRTGTGCFITYGTTLRNHTGIADGAPNRHLGWLREPEVKPDNQWNTCEITCKDDRITVKMNEVLVNEAWGAEVVAGGICLRNQNTAVEFRNIRLIPYE